MKIGRTAVERARGYQEGYNVVAESGLPTMTDIYVSLDLEMTGVDLESDEILSLIHI